MRASYSAMTSCFGTPKGVAEVVDHGGHRGAAHDATSDACGERDPQRHAEAQSAAGDARGGLPSGVVRQVAVE